MAAIVLTHLELGCSLSYYRVLHWSYVLHIAHPSALLRVKPDVNNDVLWLHVIGRPWVYVVKPETCLLKRTYWDDVPLSCKMLDHRWWHIYLWIIISHDLFSWLFWCGPWYRSLSSSMSSPRWRKQNTQAEILLRLRPEMYWTNWK